MVVDVLGAHRVAVGVALEGGRDLGLEVAHGAGDQGHAIAQQIGQQGIELTEVDGCALSRGVQVQLQCRAAHRLAQRHGTAQGVAADLHLAGQVYQGGVDHGGGGTLHRITRLPVHIAAQQHQQTPALQAGTANAPWHIEFGAQIGNCHPDLAALLDHGAVDHKVALQARHAQHVQQGLASDL